MAEGNLEAVLKVRVDNKTLNQAVTQTQQQLAQAGQTVATQQARAHNQLLGIRSQRLVVPQMPVLPKGFNLHAGVPPVIAGGGGGGGGVGGGPAAPAGGGGGGFNWRQTGAQIASQFGLGSLIRMAPAAAVVAAAFMALRRAVTEVQQAFERARMMFAKQLTSGGLPGGFVARRSLMAEMLGVGEKEVFQYAHAVEFLNDKVRFATKVYQQTTPELASASLELQALKNDFKALAMVLANDFSQAIRKVMLVIRMTIEDSVKLTRFMINNSVAGLLNKLVNQLIPGNLPNIKSPQASSMRMPSSQFERMGLVIGTGPGANYAKDTANNTKRAVTLLEHIMNAVAPRGESSRPKTGNQP